MRKLSTAIWFLIWILTSSASWSGVDAAPLPEVGSDFDAYYLAILDDPDQFLVWTSKLMEQNPPERQPVLWTRLLTARLLAGAFAGNPERKSMVPQLELGLEITREHGMLWEEFELTNVQMEVMDRNNSKEEVLELTKEIGERLLASGDFRLRAIYYRTLGSAMRVFQESRMALEYGRKALESFQTPEQQSHPLYFEIKNNVGTQFSDQFEFKKAEALYRDVAEFCESHEVRHFGSLVTFNLAHLYQTEAYAATHLPKSAEYYQKSIRMAQAINHELDVAYAYRGLGRVYTRLRNFEEAHASFSKAELLFERYETPTVWTVWLGKGLLLVQEKRHAEAIVLFEKVLEHLASSPDRIPVPLYKNLADAYMGVGSFQKSAQMAIKHAEATEKLFKAAKEQELSKLQVQLGLTLEEQKNTLLKRENELQAVRIMEGERRRQLYMVFVGLSLLALAFMGVAVAKARQVRSSREKMKLVLDNIKEGILTISSGLQIEASFSPYLKTLLNLDSDRTALETLLKRADLSLDSRDSIRQILHASINEDIIAWEANVGGLPHEVTLDSGTRVISLSWQPIAHDNRLYKVLLVLRDVTESKRLAEEVEESRHRANRLGIKLTEIISSRVPRVQNLIRPAVDELPKRLALLPDDRSAALRWIHTLKGGARTLGLQSLAESCHEAETELNDDLKKTSHSTGCASALLRDLQEYAQVLERISLASTASTMGLGDVLEGQMKAMKPRFESAGIVLEGYRLDDFYLNWTPELMRSIEPIIIHGLSNAMDHGFILPQKQGRKVKSAFFHIRAEKRGERLLLTLRDHGAGMDLAKIRDLANSKGFVPRPGQSVTDVLFLDGVSTSAEVSLTSGRGIGLSAIRQICEEHQGEVRLQPAEDGPGSELEVSLPVVA